MKVQAIDRIGEKVKLLDQTRLPTKVVYLELTDYREIIEAIKMLRIRGAPAIGIAAAYGLALAAQKMNEPDMAKLRTVGQELINARPTAVNLSWAVNRVLNKIDRDITNMSEFEQEVWVEAEMIHQEDRVMCDHIGEHGAKLFNDGDNVLTHCHTGALATGGRGTALGVIHMCREQGKKIHVYADETRPLLQGARLTAWECMEEGIPVTLLCDNTAGMLMAQGKVDKVIVGADRIAKNGDTANKIGTYSVAVLAKQHGIPFYVAAPTSTFDDAVESGDRIVIEQRGAEEVTNGFGRQTAPDAVDVYSPAFDVTPNDLITAFITDRGIKPGGRGD